MRCQKYLKTADLPQDYTFLWIAYRLVFCQNWKPSTQSAALICLEKPHIHLAKSTR